MAQFGIWNTAKIMLVIIQAPTDASPESCHGLRGLDGVYVARKGANRWSPLIER